jgi:hypothetical protein
MPVVAVVAPGSGRQAAAGDHGTCGKCSIRSLQRPPRIPIVFSDYSTSACPPLGNSKQNETRRRHLKSWRIRGLCSRGVPCKILPVLAFGGNAVSDDIGECYRNFEVAHAYVLAGHDVGVADRARLFEARTRLQSHQKYDFAEYAKSVDRAFESAKLLRLA